MVSQPLVLVTPTSAQGAVHPVRIVSVCPGASVDRPGPAARRSVRVSVVVVAPPLWACRLTRRWGAVKAELALG